MKTAQLIGRILFTVTAFGLVACGPQNKMHTIKPGTLSISEQQKREALNSVEVRQFADRKVKDDEKTNQAAPVSSSPLTSQNIASRINRVYISQDGSLTVVVNTVDKSIYQIVFSAPQANKDNHSIDYTKSDITQKSSNATSEQKLDLALSAQIKVNKDNKMIVTLKDTNSLSSSADFMLRLSKLDAKISDSENDDLAKQIANAELKLRVVQAYYADKQSGLTYLSSPANQVIIQVKSSEDKMAVLVANTQLQKANSKQLFSAQVMENVGHIDQDLAQKLDANQINIEMNTVPLEAAQLDLSITKGLGSSRIKMKIADSVAPDALLQLQQQANNLVSTEEQQKEENADATKDDANTSRDLTPNTSSEDTAPAADATGAPAPAAPADQAAPATDAAPANDSISKSGFEGAQAAPNSDTTTPEAPATDATNAETPTMPVNDFLVQLNMEAIPKIGVDNIEMPSLTSPLAIDNSLSSMVETPNIIVNNIMEKISTPALDTSAAIVEPEPVIAPATAPTAAAPAPTENTIMKAGFEGAPNAESAPSPEQKEAAPTAFVPSQSFQFMKPPVAISLKAPDATNVGTPDPLKTIEAASVVNPDPLGARAKTLVKQEPIVIKSRAAQIQDELAAQQARDKFDAAVDYMRGIADTAKLYLPKLAN